MGSSLLPSGLPRLLLWIWWKYKTHYQFLFTILIPFFFSSQVLPFPSQVVYNRVGKCGSRTVVLLLRILSEKHGFNLVTSDIHNKTRLTKNEQVSWSCPLLNSVLFYFIHLIDMCIYRMVDNLPGMYGTILIWSCVFSRVYEEIKVKNCVSFFFFKRRFLWKILMQGLVERTYEIWQSLGLKDLCSLEHRYVIFAWFVTLGKSPNLSGF